jgi:hypothetical protein
MHESGAATVCALLNRVMSQETVAQRVVGAVGLRKEFRHQGKSTLQELSALPLPVIAAIDRNPEQHFAATTNTSQGHKMPQSVLQTGDRLARFFSPSDTLLVPAMPGINLEKRFDSAAESRLNDNTGVSLSQSFGHRGSQLQV